MAGPDLSVWLGGADDDAALDLGGIKLTYGRLRARIVEAEVGSGPVGSGDPVETLIQLYAAVQRGLPAVMAPAPVESLVGSLVGSLPVPSEAFLVVSTSGSAGNARAVVRSAASWTDSFAPFTELTGLRPTDVVALTGPLISTLHLFAAVHTLALGAELTDDLGRCTAVHCVPNFLQGALRNLPPGLRVAIVAGGLLTDELEQSAITAGLQIVEYYGATELSFVAARRIPDRLSPFPGVEVEIRAGRIWARSPYLALGYVGSAAGPLVGDGAGFATVGDRGEWADGGIRVRGRDNSAITTGGNTVLAEDVETVLNSLEHVVAAAVVGEDHPRFGQIVVAILELESGYSAAVIHRRAGELLGPAARPRRWFTVARMPRTAAGKIARGQIAAGLADGSLRLGALT